MVTVTASNDGFHRRKYDIPSKNPTGTGQYHTKSGTDSGTNQYPNTVWAGYWLNPIERFNPCFTFKGIALNFGDTVASAKLRLYIEKCYKNTMFNVLAGKSPDTPLPDGTNLPDFIPTGNAITFYNTSVNPNSKGEIWWNFSTPYLDIDVTDQLQELINTEGWSSGKQAVFFVRTAKYEDKKDPYYQDDNDGVVVFTAVESVNTGKPQLIYEKALIPAISSISGDDIIQSGETNIEVLGSNLLGVNALRLYNANSYPQTIISKTDGKIVFNLAAGVPAGQIYKLEVKTGTYTANRSVEVKAAVETAPEQGGSTGTVDKATVQTYRDGHEYAAEGSGFPGTWENSASVASSTQYVEEGRILVGKWNGNIFKANIYLGPINVAKNTVIASAIFKMNVALNYKLNNFKIQAIKDPATPFISNSNLITGKALTTAQVTEENRNWPGVNPTDYWVQATNPQTFNVTAILQEVVNHANWVSGMYLPVIVDFIEVPGQQGHSRLYSNDVTAGQASTLDFVVNNGTQIVSVSGDNVLELGEQKVTIVGYVLAGASNMVISKDAVSQAQTILTNTDTNIVFNMTNGALTAGTGYTLSFQVAGKTYSKLIDITQGGGVNEGTVGGFADGHETGKVFSEEYVPFHQIVVGQFNYDDSKTYIATLRVGPINAQRGQTITSANLVWNPGAFDNAYKFLEFDIRAVKDPRAPELSQSNLISDQELTTAKVTVYTFAFDNMNDSDYWKSADGQSTVITPVIQEAVNSEGWSSGSYVQLALVNPVYPAGSGYFAFSSQESGTPTQFNYTTGSASNIANINGDNIIRSDDTLVEVTGTDIGNITKVVLSLNGRSEQQELVNNTSEKLVFRFEQGNLPYGNAQLIITIGGINYNFGVQLLPALDFDYVILGTNISKGDGSLTYYDEPELKTGDLIEFKKVSVRGFPVTVFPTGEHQIAGGRDEDSFTVRAYKYDTDPQDDAWSELQTIVYLDAGYLSRNKVALIEFVETTDNRSKVDQIAVDPDPVTPTDPTDPVDPVDPTNPTNPTDPVTPTEPQTPADGDIWVLQDNNDKDDSEVWQ